MKRIIAVAIATAVLVLGGYGIAYATIPDSSGVIDGCYKTSNPGQGALIVIDSSATCPSGTTPLHWNQAGPQGPAGAAGATGATGPAGPSTAGPAGLDIVTVWNGGNNVNNNSLVYCRGDHPYAIGGGGIATDFGSESTSQLVEDRPIGSGGPSFLNPPNPPTGWYIVGSKNNLYTAAYAI